MTCFCWCTGLPKESSGSISTISDDDVEDATDVSSQRSGIYPLYVVKCDVLSTEADMLNFKEGDLFVVMKSEGDLWYGRAKRSGKKGYVPRNCLEKCVSLYSYG